MRRCRLHSALAASLIPCQSHTDSHTACPPGLVYDRGDRANRQREERHQDTLSLRYKQTNKHTHTPPHHPAARGYGQYWMTVKSIYTLTEAAKLIVQHRIQYTTVLQLIHDSREAAYVVRDCQGVDAI